MSRPKSTEKGNANVYSEAGDPDIQTHIQFEDGAKILYTIGNSLWNLSIAQVKRHVLNSGLMETGTVCPENIGMFLLLPGEREEVTQLELDESKILKEYHDEITSGDVIKFKIKYLKPK